MLHVLNGDSTYQSLRPLQLEGRALVWRDATLQGPVPNGLASDADWRERGRWLAAHAGIMEREFVEGALTFRRDLASAKQTEEVVLWFEEDLFCQLPLCYLLTQMPAGAKWSVICPEDKLGPSPPDVLARRFDERRAADAPLVELARRAWRAYASADPREVLPLATTSDARWPLLARGLRLHLARFPAPRDGLSAMQRAMLADLASEGGESAFRDHFARLEVADREVSHLQLGVAEVAFDQRQALGRPQDVPRPGMSEQVRMNRRGLAAAAVDGSA